MIEEDIQIGSYYFNPNVKNTVYRRVRIDAHPHKFCFTSSIDDHAVVILGMGCFPAIPCHQDGTPIGPVAEGGEPS